MNDIQSESRPLSGRSPPGASDIRANRLLDDMQREDSTLSSLNQYLGVIVRRRRIVIGVLVVALLGALFVNASTVRLYRSSGSIEIAREAARVVNVTDVTPAAPIYSQEFYQTQYGLLKSRALAEQVVAKLALADNPTFMYGYSGKSAPDMSPAERAQQRPQLEKTAAKMLMAHTIIEPVRSSSLVKISFDSPDPDLSARIVNALSEGFIASNLARRFDASSYAKKFLEQRLEQVRGRLEQSERAVVDYASDKQIINLDATTTDPSKSSGTGTGTTLVSSELAQVNSALTAAEAERTAAEARYRAATQSGALAVTEGLTDVTVTQLRSTRAQLAGEYSKLLVQFRPDYPTAVALKQQIDAIDKELAAQSSNVLTSLRTNYQAAVQREAALRAQVNQLKGGMIDIRRRMIQYNIYQRDADTNRALYDALLQRYKEVGIAGGVGTNNVSIVDTALPSRAPVQPRSFTNLAIGLLAGLIAGIGLAFFMEQLDQTIVSPDDLERKLNLPLLGSIPLVKDAEHLLESLNDRRTPAAEAYLSLQTALRFTTSHGAPNVIFMTSSRPAEGKSTSSVAIASDFAQLGAKVLLIDGDMRDPSIHQMLKLPNTGGFSNMLAGATDFKQFLQKGPLDKLAIMTSGPIPPNPAELLSGPNLPLILERLLKEFDHIVIDGPPVLGLADAPLIASHVEATVFVIAARQTRAHTIRTSLRRLHDVHAHVLGTVLTKFDAKRTGYSYSYNYEYGKRRGEGDGLMNRLFRS